MKLPAIPSWLGALAGLWPYLLAAAAVVLFHAAAAKIDSLKAKVEARDVQVSALTSQRDFFAAAVKQRDALIERQNASIEAMATAAEVDRTVYLKNLEAARSVSADHLKASRELLALTAPEGELAQCRSARDLLEQELTQ